MNEDLLAKKFKAQGVEAGLKGLCKVKRSHTAIRDWIQRYKPEMLSSRKIRVTEFIIDETIIKVGSEYIWLWIAIENDNREILQISISKERVVMLAS